MPRVSQPSLQIGASAQRFNGYLAVDNKDERVGAGGREKKARLIEHLMQIAEEGDFQALPEDPFSRP